MINPRFVFTRNIARTQWNDMNNPAEAEDEKVKYVSRETEVIAWPPQRPGRLLGDVFEGL